MVVARTESQNAIRAPNIKVVPAVPNKKGTYIKDSEDDQTVSCKRLGRCHEALYFQESPASILLFRIQVSPHRIFPRVH